MRLVNATTGAVCDDADIDEHLFKWLAAEEGDQFAQWKTMQPHLAIWGEVKGTTVLDYSIAMRWACALATLHPLRYISANLQEHLIMQDNATQRASQRLSVEPTICSIKIRLVVSFYLRTADGAAALVKLFRPFISSLANQARNHAFGASGPSNFGAEGLSRLVDKYSLQRELEASWRALLTQPEKLTVDRIIESKNTTLPERSRLLVRTSA